MTQRALCAVEWACLGRMLVAEGVGKVCRTICLWAWSQGHLEGKKVAAATSRERHCPLELETEIAQGGGGGGMDMLLCGREVQAGRAGPALGREEPPQQPLCQTPRWLGHMPLPQFPASTQQAGFVFVLQLRKPSLRGEAKPGGAELEDPDLPGLT